MYIVHGGNVLTSELVYCTKSKNKKIIKMWFHMTIIIYILGLVGVHSETETDTSELDNPGKFEI